MQLVRQCARASLDGQHFDVVIIGGGINGVAIARECALAGARPLLLEQHDFASGTTSRSTRIIHGGLRYLEHGELSLVRQSLRERQRLLCERRHLVRPLQFLLAIPRDSANSRSALEIRLGLWLYGQLAGSKAFRRQARSQPGWEDLLDQDRRWAVFDYEDAQCEFPERLVAEWLVEAVEAGAVVRNHAEALEVEIRGGHVSGVLLRDALVEEEQRVTTRLVVNAAGPWVDQVCARSGVRNSTPLVGGVRGAHIVLQRFPGAPDAALYTEALDGRPIFMVPWNGLLLFGTTEIRDSGDPAKTQPSDAELDYLMSSLQRLFPRAALGWEHVQYAFAGVRPLPFAPGASPSAITRQHLLHNHTNAAGMISVIGGKLTTAAALARECAGKLGFAVVPRAPMVLAAAACDGMESTLDEWSRMVGAQAGTSEASARAIAEWHGRSALCIAAMARTCESMRQPLCDHTPHLVAEAVYAIRNEAAFTLGDVLLRRVPVALGACWSARCSELAVDRIGYALGWNARQIGAQLERLEQERTAFLQRPAHARGGQPHRVA